MVGGGGEGFLTHSPAHSLTHSLTHPPAHTHTPPNQQERDAVLSSLARRAAKLVEGLNRLQGVSCNAAEGALYAFPR